MSHGPTLTSRENLAASLSTSSPFADHNEGRPIRGMRIAGALVDHCVMRWTVASELTAQCETNSARVPA
jgi:hypothetical protein